MPDAYIPLNACMKSSNAGSKPRPCCLQPKPPPCCAGRCLLAARSPCGKSTAGRASESHPPHCLLISSPDLVMSPKPETPQQQFPHHPRHDRRLRVPRSGAIAHDQTSAQRPPSSASHQNRLLSRQGQARACHWFCTISWAHRRAHARHRDRVCATRSRLAHPQRRTGEGPGTPAPLSGANARHTTPIALVAPRFSSIRLQ